jgi:hypothetical protein
MRQGAVVAKAPRSGITVQGGDVPVILGMVGRGDRRHDVAAWFGLNQGRIKEVENGDHGIPSLAPATNLPPSGSPGPKARELRRSAAKVSQLLNAGNVADAVKRLDEAIARFDINE